MIIFFQHLALFHFSVFHYYYYYGAYFLYFNTNLPTLPEFWPRGINSWFVLFVSFHHFSVLHRCYGNTQLRLSQNHHVEDEVINTSTVLSTSRHASDCRFVSLPLLLSSPLLKLCVLTKSLEREERKKTQTLISWLLCLCTAGHIISWWNRTLKVKQQRLPSSPSFFVLVAHLWTCSLLVACLLPLLQLITSSSSVIRSHGLVLKKQTQGHLPWVLCFLRCRNTATGNRNGHRLSLCRFFCQLSKRWRWRVEEETANLSVRPNSASTVYGSGCCGMGMSFCYYVMITGHYNVLLFVHLFTQAANFLPSL